MVNSLIAVESGFSITLGEKFSLFKALWILEYWIRNCETCIIQFIKVNELELRISVWINLKHVFKKLKYC